MKTTNSNLFFFYVFALLISTSLISCGDDDENTIIVDDDTTQTLEELRIQTIDNLSSSVSKIWVFSSAVLTNSNGTFDITDNANVNDDRFIFSGTLENISLEWDARNAINLEATSPESALLDYYVAPLISSLSFDEEMATNLSGLNGNFTLEVLSGNEIQGTISYPVRGQAGETLSFTMRPALPSDENTPPTNGLQFTEVFAFENTDNAVIASDGAVGVIGSSVDNSLFIVARGENNNVQSEIIYKYNLTNGTFETNYHEQSQFVTKRLNIINNELVVFGANLANTYPLNPNGDPTSTFAHNLNLTRFGFSVQGDFGYVVGNDVGNVDDQLPAKINRYNYITNQLEPIGILPKARTYGAAEVVGNKLYVFGGQPGFITESPDAESFIYDLTTNSINSFNLPDAPWLTFSARDNNLIYVCSDIRDVDGLSEFKFGTLDTNTDTYTSISSNLEGVSNGVAQRVDGITIFNGFVYAIVGNFTSPNLTVRIMRAPL